RLRRAHLGAGLQARDESRPRGADHARGPGHAVRPGAARYFPVDRRRVRHRPPHAPALRTPARGAVDGGITDQSLDSVCATLAPVVNAAPTARRIQSASNARSTPSYSALIAAAANSGLL